MASKGQDALVLLGEAPVDVVLTDMKLLDMDGLQLLESARAVEPSPEVVIMTGFGTVETATRAIRSGAADYLLKPFRLRDVHATLVRTAERAHEARQRARAARVASFYADCVMARTRSELAPALERLPALLREVAGGDDAVAWVEGSSKREAMGPRTGGSLDRLLDPASAAGGHDPDDRLQCVVSLPGGDRAVGVVARPSRRGDDAIAALAPLLAAAGQARSRVADDR